MSEWQPARFVGAHFTAEDAVAYMGDDGELAHTDKPLIHIRPVEATLKNLLFYRSRGCDALRFFEVEEDFGAIVCEHEILTD